MSRLASLQRRSTSEPYLVREHRSGAVTIFVCLEKLELVGFERAGRSGSY